MQQVVRVPMNGWPEEAIAGDANAVRQVSLYLEGTRKLWIHWADLEWLLKSIWIHRQLQEGDFEASDDEGPDNGRSSDIYKDAGEASAASRG